MKKSYGNSNSYGKGKVHTSKKGMGTSVGNSGATTSHKTAHGQSVSVRSRAQRGR